MRTALSIQENENMIGLMMRTTLVVGAAAYAAGVMHSSMRHYFHLTSEEDRMVVQEVKIIEELWPRSPEVDK